MKPKRGDLASKRTLVLAPMTAPSSAFCAYRLPMGSVTRIRRLHVK